MNASRNVPVRVLVVTLTSDRPETESFIGLHRLGVAVHVMCTPSGTHVDRLKAAGVPMTPLEIAGRRDRNAERQIRKELLRGAYNVLHLYHNKPVQNGLRAARGLPVRIIAYRGIEGNVSFLDPVSWQRYLHPRVDRIVCVCNAIRDYFHALRFLWLRFPAQKAVRIYKGHSLAWYTAKPADRAALGLPPDAYAVCCVANWRPRKGIELLVRACAALPPDLPLHLLLVGNMDSASLKREIEASPLRERIHVLGYRRDAPEIVAACDVAVLPSLRREGLPRSVIEAMAYGVAPIVTDSGGSPELVRDSESGLVVRSGDAKHLAEALERLYADPSLRQQLGAAARERIAQHFRIEDTIAETHALYRDLLGLPAAPVRDVEALS
ncbi:MAG: glycosyltransferase family 4 protein [Pseudomonadota bacterium]